MGTPLTGESLELALALIDRHPDAPGKAGVGIKAITVGSNDYNGRCFWIERVDGSSTDFSFMRCIDGENRWSDFQKAARSAVLAQIHAFRDKAFASGRAQCSITKAVIARESSGDLTPHIDHEAPLTFDVLLRAFLADHKIDWTTVGLTSGDGLTTKDFLDQALAAQWAAYHCSNAKLRLLSRRAHLTLPRAKALPIGDWF